MKNIKDFEDYQIEALTEKAINYARVENAYFDENASSEECENLAFDFVRSFLFYMGFKLKTRENEKDGFTYYMLDGKEIN